MQKAENLYAMRVIHANGNGTGTSMQSVKHHMHMLVKLQQVNKQYRHSMVHHVNNKIAIYRSKYKQLSHK